MSSRAAIHKNDLWHVFIQGDGCNCANGQRARWRGDVGIKGNQAPSHHLHISAAPCAAGSRTHRRPNRPDCPRVHPGQQHFQVQLSRRFPGVAGVSACITLQSRNCHLDSLSGPRMAQTLQPARSCVWNRSWSSVIQKEPSYQVCSLKLFSYFTSKQRLVVFSLSSTHVLCLLLLFYFLIFCSFCCLQTSIL